VRFLAVLAAALAAASPAALAATSPAPSEVERRAALELELLRELNRVRADRGLEPLRLARGLRVAAVHHSRSMLEVGFFDHDSANGQSFDDRLRDHYTDRGWQAWTVGETLLATSEGLDARQMVAAWIKSRSHRAILLSPTWQDVGIGAQHAAVAPKSFEGLPTTVVTADFGMRSGRTSGPDE
jgi:uncharacterized protein YkwD